MANPNQSSPSDKKFSNNLKIYKHCENKTKYFNYHSQVAKAFKQDCEKFLLRFQARKDLSWQAFTEVWQELSFSLVFVGQEFVEELEVFAESSFFTIKKYITFGKDIYIQAGAFYLLYGIYTKQLSKNEQVKICLTLAEYKDILNLVQKMRERGVLEFVCNFTELECLQAFKLVHESRSYGLEPKFAWQEKKPVDDTFEDLTDTTPVQRIEALFNDEVYGLDSLTETFEEYEKALREFVAETPNTSIVVQHDAHVVQDLRTMLDELKEVEGASSSSAGATVKPKIMSLKDKAYAKPPSTVKPFTSHKE